MNKLRELYEAESKRHTDYLGGNPFMELDLSKKVDRGALDSFLGEHFPGHLNKPPQKTEVYANFYQTERKVEVGILVHYLDEKGNEQAFYFRSSATNDPLLAEELKKRRCTRQVHKYASGEGELEVMRLLMEALPIEEKILEETVEPIKIGVIQQLDDFLAVELKPLNQYGLHARPAAMIVKLLARYGYLDEIIVYNYDTNTFVSAKSIMGLMTLGAGKNKRIRFQAKGKDAEEALEKLIELFNRKFNED